LLSSTANPWPVLERYLAPLGEQLVINEKALCAILPGNRRIRLVVGGREKYTRGSSFRSIVCDDRDSMSDELWHRVAAHTLKASDSRTMLIYNTPADKNLRRMMIEHKDDPEWFIMEVATDYFGNVKVKGAD
jgi:hypothetical protein